VIAAGVSRVVVALTDPDPRVAGQGLALLRAAGVEVIAGVGEAAAAAQNRAFLHRCRQGRPLGLLKWAMSLDGRTALPHGESQWISGPPARTWVHHLRARCDAVIVGGGTVRADDPLLTSRGRRDPEPLRVVLSRTLDLPGEARLWRQEEAPTLVAHGPDASDEALARLDALQVPRLPLERCGPLPLLEALAARGCNQVLWECGPTLAAAAMREGCVQQLAAVIAPKLLGGEPARTPLGLLEARTMGEVWSLLDPELAWLDGDLLWKGRVAPPPVAR
jgi:diaminohydroxyphosphoribosylaminopyrimidine deaminase/5-amino-6-(5-phosphoribosylamino)uracil reductase